MNKRLQHPEVPIEEFNKRAKCSRIVWSKWPAQIVRSDALAAAKQQNRDQTKCNHTGRTPSTRPADLEALKAYVDLKVSVCHHISLGGLATWLFQRANPGVEITLKSHRAYYHRVRRLMKKEGIAIRAITKDIQTHGDDSGVQIDFVLDVNPSIVSERIPVDCVDNMNDTIN